MFGWGGRGCWKKCLRLWAAGKGGLPNFLRCFEQREQEEKREGGRGGRGEGGAAREVSLRERERERIASTCESFVSVTPIQACFLWQQRTQTVAEKKKQMLKRRADPQVSPKS